MDLTRYEKVRIEPSGITEAYHLKKQYGGWIALQLVTDQPDRVLWYSGHYTQGMIFAELKGSVDIR